MIEVQSKRHVRVLLMYDLSSLHSPTALYVVMWRGHTTRLPAAQAACSNSKRLYITKPVHTTWKGQILKKAIKEAMKKAVKSRDSMRKLVDRHVTTSLAEWRLIQLVLL